MSTSSNDTSTSSSFDVVTAQRFASTAAPAAAAPANGNAGGGAAVESGPRVSRAAESSLLAEQDAGVPNFIRAWYERDGSTQTVEDSAAASTSGEPSPGVSPSGHGPRRGFVVEPAWVVPAVAAPDAPALPGAPLHPQATVNTRVWFDAAEKRAAQFLAATQHALDARADKDRLDRRSAAEAAGEQEVADPDTSPEAAIAAAPAPSAVAGCLDPAVETEQPAADVEEEQEEEPLAEEEEEEEAAWILERFLKRRREAVEVADDDVDPALLVDNDDAAAAALQGRRVAPAKRTTWVYQCKWRGYDEPTWETRALLEDEGFGPEADWFDAWLAKGQKAAGVAPPAPPPSARTATTAAQFEAELAQHAAAFEAAQQKERANAATSSSAAAEASAAAPVPGLSTYAFDPYANELDFDRLFPDAAEVFRDDFAPWAIVHRVARCDKPSKNERFAAAWQTARARGFDATPVMLYHGTRRANVRSIIRKGLVVPGTNGVRMQNGAAFGVGIYTSRVSSWSARYCDKLKGSAGDRMLVFGCVGLVGAKGSAEYNGHMHVFTHSDNVLPVWLIEFTVVGDALGGSSAHPPSSFTMPMRVPLTEILRDEYHRYQVSLDHESAQERAERELLRHQRRQAAMATAELKRRTVAAQRELLAKNFARAVDTSDDGAKARGDPRKNHEIRGTAVVEGKRVKGQYIQRGVKRSDLKGETKAVKDLVRSGDLKVEKKQDRSRQRGKKRGGA